MSISSEESPESEWGDSKGFLDALRPTAGADAHDKRTVRAERKGIIHAMREFRRKIKMTVHAFCHPGLYDPPARLLLLVS
jgi:hypothetical protein